LQAVRTVMSDAAEITGRPAMMVLIILLGMFVSSLWSWVME
jgi:hypothetical protein